MRRFTGLAIAATTLTFAVCLSTAAMAADADPSMHDIYEAAQSGHLDQAQTMIDQVLKDHPKSAKAHYVQAELYAKEGKLGLARSELSRADELDPGLPFAKPQSLQELKSQLGAPAGGGRRAVTMGVAPAGPHIPWGTILLAVAVIGVLWLVFRRRSPTIMPYAVGGSPGGVGSGYGGPGPGYGGPGGYGGPVGGGGIGSGIAGGLASGLAVGAGVVAGEELAHHFLDGGQRSNTVLPPTDENWQSSNNDMGGSDFGVNDPGSWDDGGSGGGDGGGGGGGDDWS